MDFSQILEAASDVLGFSGGDSKSKAEAFDFEMENKKHEINFKKSYLRARKQVSLFICALITVWIAAMLALLLCDGMNRIPFKDIKFDVSDAVIITLVTTTTINILILLRLVVRSLFPIPGKK